MDKLLNSAPKRARKSQSAQDCDDIMADSVPYRILIVKVDDYSVCGVCSWDKLCTGCKYTTEYATLITEDKARLIIHWETVSRHFRYKEPNIIKGKIQTAEKG